MGNLVAPSQFSKENHRSEQYSNHDLATNQARY